MFAYVLYQTSKIGNGYSLYKRFSRESGPTDPNDLIVYFKFIVQTHDSKNVRPLLEIKNFPQ